jgi:hypothetical protein
MLVRIFQAQPDSPLGSSALGVLDRTFAAASLQVASILKGVVGAVVAATSVDSPSPSPGLQDLRATCLSVLANVMVHSVTLDPKVLHAVVVLGLWSIGCNADSVVKEEESPEDPATGTSTEESRRCGCWGVLGVLGCVVVSWRVVVMVVLGGAGVWGVWL